MRRARFFCEQSHSHQKRSQKRKLTIFGNTKQVIQDYDTVFDNSILLHKNDPLRITYFRIPVVPGLHFVPWHRGSGCLGAAAPVTVGAAADEHNLNVVDCDASVTVPRLSSIPVLKWGSGASFGLQYSVFSNCSSTVTVSPSGPKKLFKGVTTAMSGVIDRFPLLLPVRNLVVGYGASAVTRTPPADRSQTIFG